MGQVTAKTERTIDAPADRVYSALADYSSARPRILTEHFREYEVRTGGQGAGTIVHWKLAATQKRVRDCLIEVDEPSEHTLVERDTQSSMVTTWTVRPSGEDRAGVTAETTWQGAGGVAGIFEGVFAPKGLRRIYDEMLTNLDRLVVS